MQIALDVVDSICYCGDMKAIDHINTLVSAGWSQGKIARESGIAQPSVNRILKGKQTDVHYSQGKALERLVEKLGSGDTAPERLAA
jgi:hypothetical protein